MCSAKRHTFKSRDIYDLLRKNSSACEDLEMEYVKINGVVSEWSFMKRTMSGIFTDSRVQNHVI